MKCAATEVWKLFTFKMNSFLRDGLNILANMQDIKSKKSLYISFETA